ncbi:MAG: hypothetical protein U0165_17645 [Polyangiaceae bacterium]
MSKRGLVWGLACAGVFSACGGGPTAQPKTPDWNPENQAKCSVSKSQARPLIVEWPSPDRGALEAQITRGLVAVHYAGCQLEVLRQCRVKNGAYKYTGVTRKEDNVRIRTSDELYAAIPVYAAKFEGKLKESGGLDVAMTVVGSWEAERTTLTTDDLEGNCDKATHFISAITTGAFEFSASGSSQVGGGIGVGSVGAGAESGASKEVLNRDGYKGACEKAATSDQRPPEGCGALLRLEVVPISGEKSATAVGVTKSPTRQSPMVFQPAFPVVNVEQPPPSSWRRTAGWWSVSLGILSLAAYTGVGTVALAQKGNLDSACPDGKCPPTKQKDLDSYRTVSNIATGTLIGGAVFVTLGTVLIWTAPSGNPSTTGGRPAAPKAWVSAQAGVGSLGLGGAF